MNKSKFLKKSLAMLLALMLVFAMIPLSASAAQTDYINYLYVNGQNAAVDGDGYSVTVGDEKVTLTANLKDNVRLLYVDNQGDEKAIPTAGTPIIDLADSYTTGTPNEYALTIIAMVKENPDGSDEETEYRYPLTITVNETADSAVTALEGLAAGADTWENIMTDWSVDNMAYEVNVNLKFGAKHPTLQKDGGTLKGTDFEAVDRENGATVEVIDANKIRVHAANGSTKDYKVNYVNAPAFESFTIPDQMGETEFTYGSESANFIDIKVPYGYDKEGIIPTFELVDDLADLTLVENGSQSPYTSGVTAINTTGTYGLNYGANPWTYVFALNTTDYNGNNWTLITLRITYVAKNPAGDLLTVKVTQNVTNKASNTIEVKGTGSTDVEMPTDTDLKDEDATYTAVLTYSTSATVEVTDATRNNAVVTNTVGNSTVTIDNIKLKEGNSFSINVKSEDGKVNNVYNINLHAAATAEAMLTSVSLKDKGDNGKLYEAKITNEKADEGTVTLKVPFSWKDTANASDVFAFIKASTGATVTLLDKDGNPTAFNWEESDNGKHSLQVLTDGLNNTDGYDWFPFPGSETSVSKIQVTNSANGVNVKRTYTVKIETETAKGGRTIESLDFSSEDTVKKITADNTFSAELGTAVWDDGSTTGKTVNTIKVTVPYSWDKSVGYDGLIHLYNLKLDDGAKMYAQISGTWTPVSGVDATGNLNFDVNVTNAYDVVKDGKIAKNDLTKATAVRVLSEANSVNFTETTTLDEVDNAVKNGPYTEYYIYCVKAPVETDAELLSIESTVDENVTATLNGTTITITVPYSYPDNGVYVEDPECFTLNFTTSKQATVYQGYDATNKKYVNKLVSDQGKGRDEVTDASVFGVYETATTKELYLTSAKRTGTSTNLESGSTPAQITGDNAPNKIWVVAEDGVTANAYDVKLVIDKEQTGADVTALSVNGTAATIARDQINVRLPLGTKLYPVTLDIDASKMATVYVSPTTEPDPTAASHNGKYLYDPEARYDVNRPLKITVVAEDGETSKIYTLTATVASNFEDVPTDQWYYDEVMIAANAGWVNGVGKGQFEPNGTMKRGDFAVIIARILGCDTEATVESKFPDCNETDYFNAAVTFCQKRGIIDGDDKGYFNPYDAITREEMAKILCNALELDELETSANPFDDDAEIAQWAKGYVNAVQAEGIMEGSNGSFNPRDNATRAEGAAVLVRAFA